MTPMTKRGRVVSIDRLIGQLNQLDRQRKALTARIQHVVGARLDSGGERLMPAERRGLDGRGVDSAGGRKRNRKRTMSAAARKAISDAQKKRWAKQRAAVK